MCHFICYLLSAGHRHHILVGYLATSITVAALGAWWSDRGRFREVTDK